MKIKTKAGLKVRAQVKAGGVSNLNHAQSGLKVRVNIRAGEIMQANHSRLVTAAA